VARFEAVTAETNGAGATIICGLSQIISLTQSPLVSYETVRAFTAETLHQFARKLKMDNLVAVSGRISGSFQRSI